MELILTIKNLEEKVKKSYTQSDIRRTTTGMSIKTMQDRLLGFSSFQFSGKRKSSLHLKPLNSFSNQNVLHGFKNVSLEQSTNGCTTVGYRKEF